MRLAAAIALDAKVQARNQLWGISVFVGLVGAAALAWLSPPDRVGGTIPMALLLFAGGSTLLYVVAMLLMERSDGTLSAISVSPLRRWEYLASKVLTLTALATIESVVMAYGALAVLARRDAVDWPSPVFFAGVVALGALHVLIGVILVVRYRRINEVLLPMGAIALVLQLPAFWMVGAIEGSWALAIPSAAPTLLVRAGFVPLTIGQWIYAVAGTTALLVGAALWASRAFERHVVRRGG